MKIDWDDSYYGDPADRQYATLLVFKPDLSKDQIAKALALLESVLDVAPGASEPDVEVHAFDPTSEFPAFDIP